MIEGCFVIVICFFFCIFSLLLPMVSLKKFFFEFKWTSTTRGVIQVEIALSKSGKPSLRCFLGNKVYFINFVDVSSFHNCSWASIIFKEEKVSDVFSFIDWKQQFCRIIEATDYKRMKLCELFLRNKFQVTNSWLTLHKKWHLSWTKENVQKAHKLIPQPNTFV